MRLLRVGKKGSEKPAILDTEGKTRDISSLIKDLSPDYINFDTISKLQSTDISSLPELSSSERIGHWLSCYKIFFSLNWVWTLINPILP